jgi:hypothetical protein
MASFDPRSQVVRSTRSSRWQRARRLTFGLALSSGVGMACGTGPIGGGSGGVPNWCIDDGDICTPGVPVPRDRLCLQGVDCCVNTCTCGEDGRITCRMVCEGSGGSCGGGPIGTRCDTDSQCHSLLKCCYPCGIEGCQNECMMPMPNGQCPLFP